MTIKTADVLIVGGGSSGLWAAKRIKELDPKRSVLIVDKGPLDWGGLMSMCGGDMVVVMPDENVDDWVEELTYYWDGLCEQDVVEEVLRRSYDRFLDYQRFGCNFFKQEDGTLKSVPQRGLKHCKLYPAQFKGTGGEDMVRGILGEVKKLGAERMGRTLVTDILKEDGRAVGAVGFDTINGDFYVFRANAILIATGQAEWKPAYHQNTATGEGMEMAFRAGVELRNFEFVKVWNVPKDFTWEGQTTLLPLGGRFVNALGEPFMDKYMPSPGSNTDPHYITRAMALETRAGRGPIYFDISRIRAEDMGLIVPQSGWQLLNYQKLVAQGMDLINGPKMEWIPHLQDTCGGIRTDLWGATAVPGVFAAGRARSIDPGVYIGGFAMCTTAVTGHMTGEAIVEYLAGLPGEPPAPDEALVEECRRRLYRPLGRKGVEPSLVLRALREILFPYDVCILKSEASLTRALEELERVKADLMPDMAAADPHYLMKLREVMGMAMAAELYLKASLLRTESRAGHFREDHPGRDKDGPYWIVIGGGGEGAPWFRKEPVPVARYKHPVDRFYSDLFDLTGGGNRNNEKETR
ncbi:FAD-dependent oxidoreductase [Moorella sulfitireducens]|uniref:FAD-dependent oxidoreductase n=1 Tax=Neomoorella sulfitireducens TaxID=2972948 RepID=UPI0021AD0054|nr:FAD-binding protein [Moorella sulfitireducens]